MGGPISAVFSDIFMCKMEFDVVVPAKPIFYKSYVDDTYVQRKKNDVDKLLEELNSYNENIKLTLKVNPTQFLDTELVRENVSQQSCLCTGDKKFLLDTSSML